ncbi:hypothetical protein VaNZ11_005470 [Volvox africanus]|uniref:Glycosyl transferase CAP10 domain-containing protein n=1 Tax=Volvox africanus TaxID=51714 RepID=A0ABQ5RZQ0_9CHLO|nr:hypothetical protein VaNZ11_005470 [Volvox africanus]
MRPWACPLAAILFLGGAAQLIATYKPHTASDFALRSLKSDDEDVGATNTGALDSAGQSTPMGTDIERPFNYTTLDCSRYEPTFIQIARDLQYSRKLGISLNSTLYMSARFGSVHMRGLTVGFFGGTAYLLTPTDFRNLSHHAPLHLAYMRMMLHLESSFGAALPDVAFVLTTSDTPRYVSPLLVNSTSPLSELRSYEPGFVPGPYPVCGIGKSDFFPDFLLVPNFHFHMKLYDQTFLAAIPEFNKMSWRDRKPVLFGRFSRYRTNRVSEDIFTYKAGPEGRRICYKGNRTCPFRDFFINKIVPKDPARMDVSFIGRVSMLRHSHYKYLAHLDGQGISSRLEQLLSLGSLVFKEASGYYAYYYRSLLQHRVSLVEFWRDEEVDGPEDVLRELDWAEANDEEAARVAAEGQRIAATYLTGNGRTCYWYRLMHGLRSVLSYTPLLSQWPEAQPLRLVVEQQLLATPGGKEVYDAPWAP